MEGLNRPLSPLFDPGASTSSKPPSPVPDHIRASHAPGKRKELGNTAPTYSEQTSVKRRKIEDIKQDAITNIEEWLNKKGVDTQALKPKDDPVDKLVLFKRKLQHHYESNNDAALLCNGNTEELAEVLYNFNFKLKHQHKSDIDGDIIQLNYLIKETENLKDSLSVSKENYNKLIDLRSRILKSASKDNRSARKKIYTSALYINAFSLATSDLSKTENKNIMGYIESLGQIVGATPKKEVKIESYNAYIKKKKVTYSNLNSLLSEKYKLGDEERSRFKQINIATDIIKYIKSNNKIPDKKDILSNYTQLDRRVHGLKKNAVRKTSQEYSREDRQKTQEALIKLQETLGEVFTNLLGRPDDEGTIRAAYNFLNEYQTAESAKKEPEIRVTPDHWQSPLFIEQDSLISLGSTILQKDIQQPEHAYKNLKKALNCWPCPPIDQSNHDELICAAVFCIKSLRWVEPITDLEYKRFKFRKLADIGKVAGQQTITNTLLESLKNELKEVRLDSEAIENMDGMDIINMAAKHLNEMASQSQGIGL